MRSTRPIRNITYVVAIGALATALGACGTSDEPETPTSTTTSVSPTEKSIDPTGGNLFTPPVKAPPPATAPPGNMPGAPGQPG